MVNLYRKILLVREEKKKKKIFALSKHTTRLHHINEASSAACVTRRTAQCLLSKTILVDMRKATVTNSDGECTGKLGQNRCLPVFAKGKQSARIRFPFSKPQESLDLTLTCCYLDNDNPNLVFDSMDTFFINAIANETSLSIRGRPYIR